jgi:hypothetical protein
LECEVCRHRRVRGAHGIRSTTRLKVRDDEPFDQGGSPWRAAIREHGGSLGDHGEVLGSGVAALDATVVGIALPALGRDLHADVAGLRRLRARGTVS